MNRVIFKKDEQKEFIESICGKNIRRFCRINKQFKIPYSTFKKYRSETLNLPLDLYLKLKKIKSIKKKFDIKIVNIKVFYSKGGKRGIKTLLNKYDAETLRSWRSKGGKKGGKIYMYDTKRFIKIDYPELNNEFAEFIGAYLGDGTLTEYFLRIFGDKRYDLPYLEYLANITKNLFGLNPKIRIEKNRNVALLEIRSKLLCNFLKEKFNLYPGNKLKNRTKIPIQIIKNKELFMHCLRGLIDTDGSISKDNDVLSVRFNTYNLHLFDQVYELGKKYELFTFSKRFGETGTKSRNKVLEYFRLVGSSNLRHIVRFEEFLKGNVIEKKKVNVYYKDYKNLDLPHFGSMV